MSSETRDPAWRGGDCKSWYTHTQGASLCGMLSILVQPILQIVGLLWCSRFADVSRRLDFLLEAIWFVGKMEATEKIEADSASHWPGSREALGFQSPCFLDHKQAYSSHIASLGCFRTPEMLDCPLKFALQVKRSCFVCRGSRASNTNIKSW